MVEWTVSRTYLTKSQGFHVWWYLQPLKIFMCLLLRIIASSPKGTQ